MRRLVLSLLMLVIAATLAAQALAGRGSTGPVIPWKTTAFGKILATPGHLALYTWTKEKALKVRCTGACAKTWPPVTVPHGTMVPRHITGVMGTFGELMRPDGTTQVTYDGHALYTFHGDTPTKILCNGVDGWYVVKAH